MKNKVSLLRRFLTSLPLQDFSSREINFYFCQFFSNFLRYFSLNFLLFYLYNILAVYFSSNFSLLKFLSSILSIISCLLTSALSLPSNSTITSFASSKSTSFSQILYSAIKSFYLTKYLTHSHTILLLRILSTSYFFSPSIYLYWFWFFYLLLIYVVATTRHKVQ